jgi:hypothetical protein
MIDIAIKEHFEFPVGLLPWRKIHLSSAGFNEGVALFPEISHKINPARLCQGAGFV